MCSTAVVRVLVDAALSSPAPMFIPTCAYERLTVAEGALSAEGETWMDMYTRLDRTDEVVVYVKTPSPRHVSDECCRDPACCWKL